MALFDNLFKKTYTTMIYCNNCLMHSEVKIPKGVTIIQFLETGLCPQCNCSTLVADYKQIDEFKQQVSKQLKPLAQNKYRLPQAPIQRTQVPAPRPSNRPANLPRPQPRPLPVEPDFSPKTIFRGNTVDFWNNSQRRRQ